MTDVTSLRDSSHLLRIMALAGEVTYNLCMTTIYSSWHSWKQYRNVSPLPAEDTAHSSDTDSFGGLFSDSSELPVTPYGSCVDIAISATHAFSLALASVPELHAYASAVSILARTASTDACRITHCLTALPLDTCCIVIDPSFDFAPVLLAHGERDALPSLGFYHFDGRMHHNYMRYAAFPGYGNHRPQLLWHGDTPFGCAIPFFPITAHEAIEQVSVPMALDTAAGVDSRGRFVPRVKAIKFQRALRRENPPVALPWRLVGGRCIVTVCRIRVDFLERRISVLLPYLDWLAQGENEGCFIELRKSGLFQGTNEDQSVAILVLDCNRSDKLWKRKAKLVGEVVEKVTGMSGSQGVGMRRREFREVVDSVVTFGQLG